MLFNERKNTVKTFHDYSSVVLDARHRSVKGEGIKISTPKQVCQQHPPIALAQVKPVNTYGNSLNEILYKLYILDFEKKKLLKHIRIITM